MSVQTFTLLMLPALIRCRLPKKCFKIRENQGIYWYYDWRRFKYVQTVILLVGINIILKDFKLRETRDITEMRAQPVKIFWSLHTSKTLFIYNVRDLFFFYNFLGSYHSFMSHFTQTRDIKEMRRAEPGSASKDFLVTTSRQIHFLFITSEICFFFLQFPRLLSLVHVSFYTKLLSRTACHNKFTFEY